MVVLGIETSCDDTGIGIFSSEKGALANVVLSSANLYEKVGGVLPEIASREHIRLLPKALEKALSLASLEIQQIDCVAVTNGPGLIGSLLVGLSFAKALSFSLGVPLVGVDHLFGHIQSLFVEKDIELPCVVLVVSGGHTSLYYLKTETNFELLGYTLDDAAGEAFDKIAHFLSLGYPGGPRIEKLARAGDPNLIDLPRPLLFEKNLLFSFSGLKTATIKVIKQGKYKKEDVCAGFQEAVFEVLSKKLILAAEKKGVKSIGVCGGVSANKRFREILLKICKKHDLSLHFPDLSLCQDNGLMIAKAGLSLFYEGKISPLDLDAYSTKSIRKST